MREQRYVIVITPEGAMYPVHCWPENTLRLETLQGLVDGNVETVAALPGVRWDRGVNGDPVLLVNGEGELRGLPQNDLATEMTVLWEDSIVGTAVLMGALDEELIGMTRETAEDAMRSWAENGDQ